ncbi:MAG TPA: molybdopterin dehydrogenase, partial [Clostridia bacterium]|nr:molybdopterin dehydrogenase [Clostridia bacterium]
MTIKDYYRPQTLEEAVTLLDRFPENTKILAGGTDLIIQMRLKETKPDYLLDLGGINCLKEIKTKDNYLAIGSMATFFELEQNPMVQKYLPVLAEASASIGSPQIRSRATIGGNIANAAPAADTLPALLALDSQIKLQSGGGTRTVSLSQILLGINQTD